MNYARKRPPEYRIVKIGKAVHSANEQSCVSRTSENCIQEEDF